jgi:class 3 adenylate cyclase
MARSMCDGISVWSREMHRPASGKIIVRYSGTLERDAGDGVRVVFNDPIPVGRRAVQMALEMRVAIGH